MAHKNRHKSSAKVQKSIKKGRKMPLKIKNAAKKITMPAGKSTSSRLKTKKVLQKAQSVQKKEVIEQAIKKIYTEKERLEMQRLYVILSEPYARQLLINLAGENALEIVRNFYGSLSDEDLAKKLKLKISDVRATLNKLHSEGLVNYLRDKDNETGWYSYSWALNRERIKQWVELKVREKTDLVNGTGGDHYFCPSCGPSSVVKFEIASDTSFKCPKCSKNLDFLDEDKISELIIDIRLRK